MLHWGSNSAVPTGHPRPSPSPQVLAAGIEANIPVTYGIGSQRGHESTGCQFIGQSPVHSVSAACQQPATLRHPGPDGMAVDIPAGLLGGSRLSSAVGTGPPQITAAPLELVGTSTWSCCYRGWEPLGGLGPAHLASPLGQRSGEYPMPTHLRPWVLVALGPWSFY